MLEALRALDPARCAGVIQLTSFNCGCDSMAGPYYRETLKAAGIPFMALTLDAHTALAGLDTRLEAFVESIAGRA
jgi:predicted nucleotide-binding protein (sugar kinase/HSP70/actin superfamily)